MAWLFGGKNISYSSNIVFSNGDMDPWTCGGVKEDLSPSLKAVLIEEVGTRVAIASGKCTVSSREPDLLHLNSGSLARAQAWRILQKGGVVWTAKCALWRKRMLKH